MHSSDEAELANIDPQGGIFDLMLEQAAGEIGRGKTVGLGDLANIVELNRFAVGDAVGSFLL